MEALQNLRGKKSGNKIAGGRDFGDTALTDFDLAKFSLDAFKYIYITDFLGRGHFDPRVL